jgi:hypothetical protein
MEERWSDGSHLVQNTQHVDMVTGGFGTWLGPKTGGYDQVLPGFGQYLMADLVQSVPPQLLLRDNCCMQTSTASWKRR